jgi:hypothetical protein
MVVVSQVVALGQEIIPILVKDNYLYINANRGGDNMGPGYIYRYDLNTGNRATVATISRYSAWQGVIDYIGRRVVRFGQFNDPLKSGVAVFDPYKEQVSTAYHPNTADINEFIGVAYDHKNKRFIVGERQYDPYAVSSGSSWPNGGGLWVIPYESLLDYTKWQRVYEFANNPEVTSVAVFKGYVYVGLWRAGQLTKVSRAEENNLTSWRDVRSGLNPNVRPYVDAEDNILAIGYGTSDNKFRVEWTSDGSTWNYVDVTPSSTDSDMLMNVKVVGKYIVVGVGKQPSWRSDLFLVDTSTNSVYTIQTNLVGSINNKPFFYDGSKNLYIGAVNYNSNEASAIYSMAFDGIRVLSLSVSGALVAGNTVKLVATLTDGANPVPNAVVEFYVVDSIDLYSPIGTLIGTATTDSSGRASVSYTVPSNAVGTMMFAAIYKG